MGAAKGADGQFDGVNFLVGGRLLMISFKSTQWHLQPVSYLPVQSLIDPTTQTKAAESSGGVPDRHFRLAVPINVKNIIDAYSWGNSTANCTQ